MDLGIERKSTNRKYYLNYHQESISTVRQALNVRDSAMMSNNVTKLGNGGRHKIRNINYFFSFGSSRRQFFTVMEIAVCVCAQVCVYVLCTSVRTHMHAHVCAHV